MLLRLALGTCLLLLLTALARAETNVARIERWVDPPARLDAAAFLAAGRERLVDLPDVRALLPRQGERKVLRLTIGDLPPERQRLLVLRYTFDAEVIVYAPPEYRPVAQQLDDPSRVTPFSRSALAFELPDTLKEGDAIWVEIPRPRRAAIPIVLRGAVEHAQIDLDSVRFNGAVLTVLLGSALVALGFFLLLREPSWLVFALGGLAFLLHAAIRTGELFSMPGFAALAESSVRLSIFGALGAAALNAVFAILFMDLRRSQPRVAAALAAAAVLLGGCALLAVLPGPAVQTSVAAAGYLTVFATSLLSLGAAVRAVLAGQRTGMFFLAGWTPVLVLNLLLVAFAMGWLVDTGWIHASHMTASAFAAVVLPIGMADRALRYRRERDAAEARSLRDPLTGCANRRALLEALDAQFTHVPAPRALAVCVIDLDHFKRVNDTHGHALGDAALCHVAGLIAAELRGGDLLARYGGEEFVALLPGAGPREVLAVAERIRSRVQDGAREVGGIRLDLTVSIGLAARGPAIDSPQALLAAADAALYRAKSNGRNGVEADAALLRAT